MIKREIVLDEDSNRILESLAQEQDADVSVVVCQLLRMYGMSESALDSIEEPQRDELIRQKERSEREFQDGKVVPWSELKRQCGL